MVVSIFEKAKKMGGIQRTEVNRVLDGSNSKLKHHIDNFTTIEFGEWRWWENFLLTRYMGGNEFF